MNMQEVERLLSELPRIEDRLRKAGFPRATGLVRDAALMLGAELAEQLYPSHAQGLPSDGKLT